jgi:hypothetical protein
MKASKIHPYLGAMSNRTLIAAIFKLLDDCKKRSRIWDLGSACGAVQDGVVVCLTDGVQYDRHPSTTCSMTIRERVREARLLLQ